MFFQHSLNKNKNDNEVTITLPDGSKFSRVELYYISIDLDPTNSCTYNNLGCCRGIFHGEEMIWPSF